MIFNMTGGAGSSATLNFKVVGGTTKPVSPSENMIWVNTNAEVTGYTFSMTEPENPTEGIVWIATASSSVVSFSATKKNSIMVYPMAAKQYINGLWTAKSALIYQDEKWNEWILYLYKDGDECNSVTGGYSTYYEEWNGEGCTVTKNSSGIKFYSYNGAQGLVLTNNKIDLSGVNKLTASISDMSSQYSFTIKLIVSDSKLTSVDEPSAIASISYSGDAVASGSSTTMSLDVSGISSGYVYVYLKAGGNYTNVNFTVTKIVGE